LAIAEPPPTLAVASQMQRQRYDIRFRQVVKCGLSWSKVVKCGQMWFAAHIAHYLGEPKKSSEYFAVSVEMPIFAAK